MRSRRGPAEIEKRDARSLLSYYWGQLLGVVVLLVAFLLWGDLRRDWWAIGLGVVAVFLFGVEIRRQRRRLERDSPNRDQDPR